VQTRRSPIVIAGSNETFNLAAFAVGALLEEAKQLIALAAPHITAANASPRGMAEHLGFSSARRW
jgi:hypothetical protein